DVVHAQDANVRADTTAVKTDSMEIYGYVMMDAGYNFNQIDPNWFDVVRPTKLPSSKNEFGTDGNTYLSVRQTRFGVKNYFNTPLGQMKTQFEFEMFGTGVDAGQTTIRLRHAYGELGKFGAGQYWSPFMDIDVFPNTVEYWGPNGMVFFRNVQLRYMPIKGEYNKLTFALERPGASADQGVYKNRIELQNVSPRFPLPDLSGEYRMGGKWGYLELAGILRRIEWKDQNADSINLSGHATGWGLNLSTNIKLGKKALFKGQAVYGKGIENYMNDAPVDIAIKNNFSNPTTPVIGVALPVLGIVAFLDLKWNKKFSSSIGYSRVDIDNTNAQDSSAFKNGQYAIANFLYYPSENTMAGIEYQWGDRNNFKDGFHTSISKIQLSFRYNFSQKIYRNR
ncbi:MAG: DcaP family trimeric outer membrane transporter, partial [Cytophagaceae bacterium]